MFLGTMHSGHIDPVSANGVSVGEITLPKAKVVRIRPMFLTNTGYSLLFHLKTTTGGTALAVTTAQFYIKNNASVPDGITLHLDPGTQYYLYWGIVNTTALIAGGAADYIQVSAEN